MPRFEDYRVLRTALGGRLLQLEIGKVCEQANGQVMVKYGDTVVNVTVCASKEPKPDIDFFPLSVDYEERMYAAGKIPGGFIKREGRPSEHAILTSRLIDRPIRPLFPKGYYNDVVVVATVMSVDLDCSPEICGMIGSSVALAISDIPWDGPTGSVSVGRVDGRLIINPSLEQREKSDIHMTVSGTKDAIMMVEAGANEVPEMEMLDAILFAHEEIKELVAFIEEVVKEVGRPKQDVVLYKPLPEIDEADMMVRTVKALQGVTDAPLQLDSTDPKVLERALRVYCGKAIVNSVNGEEESLSAILPLVKKYGAAVVGLTLDQGGIPKSAQARVEVARRILERALALGIRREDVYIDCLTLTVSAEQEGAAQTLTALRRVKEELGLKTVLGVSNISFGLPARPLVNQNFLAMAMAAGLDLPILNPNVDTMMAAVRCYHLLTNVDRDAREFIAAYGNAAVTTAISGGGAAPTAAASGRGLAEVVEAGLKGEAAAAARTLLETREPMDVVDHILIPALDKVGGDFEQNRVFLPQLIQSAGAAQAAFEVIRESLSQRDGGTVSRGTVVLATVKGDIHDIGKNIVKVLLENYGYTVVDLGKDVDPSAVVEAVRRHAAPLVGLSALMTTTLKSMAETISMLHDAGLTCQIMVGGAVLTPDYARQIQADFYARDAKESVDIAKRVIG